jgi:hypothetical protein
LETGASSRGEKESGLGGVSEFMAQDAESAGRITEIAGDLGRGAVIDIKSAQGFVLSLFGMLGIEEKPFRVSL